MNSSWITQLLAHYDWLSSLIALGIISAVTVGVKFLLFKVPAIKAMRELNEAEDAKKMALPKYPPLVRDGNRVGFLSSVALFVLVLPFCITAAYTSIATVLIDAFVILMVFDLFYYLTHRFLLHGQGPLRRVHAVHHQARNPSFIDSAYVHPIEVFIGSWLFILSIAFLSMAMGRFHIATIVIAFIAYAQINTINHVQFNLTYFPFKTVNWIVAKHHVHHENMHKGNYASISMFYDKLFGTLD